VVVRAVIGLLNAAAMLHFKAALGRSFGRTTANWYALLQACQFHVIYYASRTLPNMFAYGLSKKFPSRIFNANEYSNCGSGEICAG
jgi:alpha-1,6-mannosyltransferase